MQTKLFWKSQRIYMTNMNEERKYPPPQGLASEVEVEQVAQI